MLRKTIFDVHGLPLGCAGGSSFKLMQTSSRAKSLTSGLDTLNEIVRALGSLGIEFANGDAIGVRLNTKALRAKK